MAKFTFDDIVSSLKTVGGQVSNQDIKSGFSINSRRGSIGGFGHGMNTDEGNTLALYNDPFSLDSPAYNIKVKYKGSGDSREYVILYDWAKVKATVSSSVNTLGSTSIKIDGKKYSWTTNTVGSTGKNIDGIYIIPSTSGTDEYAFYAKRHVTMKPGEILNDKLSIPFYHWYLKNNNEIWIATILTVYGPDDSYTLVKGWFKAASNANGYLTIYNTLCIKPNKNSKEFVEYSKAKLEEEEKDSENPDGTPADDQGLDYKASDEWENSQGGYDESLLAADSAAQFNYWSQLYGKDMGGYSLKSHRSIIGLPLQFMSNVDMRVGSSTYGKQYMEDILYDMSIACIKPGGPVLNPKFGNDETYSDDIFTKGLRTIGEAKAYWDSLSKHGFGNTLKSYIFTLFKGGNARFYSFQSDYTHYTHYVNTLCHLFITYLGIGDKYYTTGSGTRKKYTFYSDEPAEIETDGGLGMGHQFGFDNAVYVYYSPESGINHSFSNSTMSSSLNDTLKSGSDAAKEWGFFINAAGIEKGNGVTQFGQELAANNGSGILGRLFGNLAEGVTTVLAGNNLSLPDIYSDSETSVHHQFKIKLASPYGDPESVFLYVLRPLARLLAFSLPRQYGPNSYMSPFIVQAFSKGQFNCQLGIVTSLSITRCGNGGESHTINHIPTELEVNLEIEDMYEKIFLSNEFFGNSAWKSILGGAIDYVVSGFNPNEVGNNAGTALMQTGMTLTATRLLFNNVGLIDFVASFCGANLNQQTHMSGWTMIWNMMKNRTGEIVSYNENDGWKFPQWEKQLNDSYRDAVTKLTTTITTIA